MKKILLLSAMFMAFVSLSNAQIKTPPASPLCKINQEVGLIKVDVEYSRPSAKGRRIFGELVPFGQMWRTGANASTKITLSDDAMIGGVAVKKGTYAIYATPGEKDWTIIIYKILNSGVYPVISSRKKMWLPNSLHRPMHSAIMWKRSRSLSPTCATTVLIWS